MIVSVVLANTPSWLGGSFESNGCDWCGSSEKLECFRIETWYDGKIVYRKARLCCKCLKKAEAGAYQFICEKSVQ